METRTGRSSRSRHFDAADDDGAQYDDGYDDDYVGDGLDGTDDYVGDGLDGADDDAPKQSAGDHGATAKNAIISPQGRAAICKKRKIGVL